MTLTEIKKALYKQKPVAGITSVSKEGIIYVTELEGKILVPFCVPLSDIGDALFTVEIESQLLIRYIVEQESWKNN